MKLYTASEVAEHYHISSWRVRAIAINRQVGTKLANGAWVFTVNEVERLLRADPAGRRS